MLYTALVVLLGAVVRITGSGAGCGQHWPTCRGEVVHLPQSLETAIELSHRLTSGVSILLAVALPVYASRLFPRGHGVRRAAMTALGLMVVEALIGAVLVLFRLVAEDASLARAVVLPIHLMNTSLLLGAMAITAWGSIRETLPLHWPRTGIDWTIPVGMVGVMVVSGTGAVTALGDALFPVSHADALAARVLADQSAYAHFLQRMRVIHPAAAVIVGVALVFAVQAVGSAKPSVASWVRTIQVLAVVQLAAGIANVLLSAPGWMQVAHLALAIGLWLALVLGWAAVCEAGRADADAPEVPEIHSSAA